jgi:hypothetical protein
MSLLRRYLNESYLVSFIDSFEDVFRSDWGCSFSMFYDEFSMDLVGVSKLRRVSGFPAFFV